MTASPSAAMPTQRHPTTLISKVRSLLGHPDPRDFVLCRMPAHAALPAYPRHARTSEGALSPEPKRGTHFNTVNIEKLSKPSGFPPHIFHAYTPVRPCLAGRA